MKKISMTLLLLAAGLLGSTIAGPARAGDAVKIGVIYPLTGNAASAGASAKDAVELSSTARIPSWQAFHLLQVPACRIWAAQKLSWSVPTTRAIRKWARTRRCA
jgi:hypothetical protein